MFIIKICKKCKASFVPKNKEELCKECLKKAGMLKNGNVM
jgi:hypothetical protein